MKGIYKIGDDIVFHDPDPEMAKVFLEFDPSYKVKSFQPSAGFTSKFQVLCDEMVQVDDPLIEMNTAELLETLNKSPQHKMDVLGGEIVSKLKVLHALSLGSFSECRLCGWDCGVNRYHNASGRCGLGSETFWNVPFTHIAEEASINPAIVVNIKGCALKCVYCIDHDMLNAERVTPSNPKALWSQIIELQSQDVPITSLEFTNPTESLPGIIRILKHAPVQFNLPVVLNCHSYGSSLFYEMAKRIADVWLLDLRYGNDRCAKKLSEIDDYMKYTKIGLNAMKGERVIVRILVLPGHVSCCHAPALELLSEYRDYVWVSVLDQYVPEHEAYLDPVLSRRPTKEEILEVESLVKRYGLKDINSMGEKFWLN